LPEDLIPIDGRSSCSWTFACDIGHGAIKVQEFSASILLLVAPLVPSAHDRFDGVGDDFTRDERIFHDLRSHGDSVGHSDGVEEDGLAAGFVRAGLSLARELVILRALWLWPAKTPSND
jgi:hypothetical protein